MKFSFFFFLAIIDSQVSGNEVNLSLVIIRSEPASLFCLVWHSGVHMRPAARCIPVWIRSLEQAFLAGLQGLVPGLMKKHSVANQPHHLCMKKGSYLAMG